MKNRQVHVATFLFLIATTTCVQAQQLLLQGKITFERKENILKLFDGDDGWTAEIKKTLPKYKVDHFNLSFNTSECLYTFKPDEDAPTNGFLEWFKVASSNTVQQQFKTKRVLCSKTIYENTYFIEDSLPQLKWKLTSEFRNIAGFSCRRATTIIHDSIYVIAFYTDEIPVSGGPESFQGLPGMILGIVLPRLNMTYFATHVDHVTVTETEMKWPLKPAKKVYTQTKYFEELRRATSDWGDEANRILWKAGL